jgi:type IV pilus assembly protein PilP
VSRIPALCVAVLVASVAASVFVGCQDEVVVGPAVAPTPGPSGGAPGAAPDAGFAPLEYDDEVFVEAETVARDPFRSFASAFKVKAIEAPQRRVLMPHTTIAEMRLIAIVTGLPQPRAMLADAANVGHVVKRGDYLGRAEVVQTGGSEGMPLTLNWRVDRIRENEIVLSREDPTTPNNPPLTRVIPLHDPSEGTGVRPNARL